MSFQRCSFIIKDNILLGKKIGCDGLESMNVGKLILQTLNSDLKYVAQVDAETGKEITFEEIRNNSVKLAIWMKFENVYPGDLIGICTDYPVMLYAILACLYIGAIPMVRQYNKCTDLETSCDFARINPKILFVNRIQSKEFESENSKISNFVMVPSLIVIGSSQFLYKKFSFAYDVLITNMDKCYNVRSIEKFNCTELDDFRLQTAMILHTRGIEGSAKAVKIPHKAILAPINYEVFTVLPGIVGMLMEQHFLYLNLILTIQSILMYKRLVIFKGDNIVKFWRAIEIYKVNWVRLETNMSQAILNSLKDSLTVDISSLKMLMFSGSSMKYSIHADLDRLLPETSLISLYGTTETGIISFQRFNRKFGSSGKVGRNIDLMITDISGTSLASNIPGKIWCKGYGMSNAYYCADKVSIQIPNDNGWYDTGDIGYYDNDGDIYVINRAVDLIYFKETYFSPAIIENLIKKHPDVDDVAVVEKPDNINKQVLVAFITEKTGKHVVKQEIIDIMTNITWNCMKLQDVVLLDKMWYRLDGNIDRNYLRYKTNFEDTFVS